MAPHKMTKGARRTVAALSKSSSKGNCGLLGMGVTITDDG